MTKNQERLLDAARKADDYLNRLNTGRSVRGMYEGIGIARELHAAVVSVENDLIHDAAKLLVEQS